MASTYRIGRFQFQGGTKGALEASGLILLENEIALERDEETNSIKMRIGDGKSKYADCPYIDIGTYSVESLRDEDIEKIRGPQGRKGDPFTVDDFTAEQWLDLKGEPGKSIEITGTQIEDDGSLTINFNNGSSISVPRGPEGPEGPAGKDGTNANVLAGTGLRKSGDTLSINSSYVALKSDLSGYAKASDIPKFKEMYQGDYKNLSYKDPNTYYFIKEES